MQTSVWLLKGVVRCVERQIMSVMSGWYPDPTGSADLRFWDGQNWTTATTPAVAAVPAPAPAQPSFAGGGYQQQGMVTSAYAGRQQPQQQQPQAVPSRVTYASTMGKRRSTGRGGAFYGIVAGGAAAVVAIAVAIPLALHHDKAAGPVAITHPVVTPTPAPTASLQLPARAAGLVRIQGARADQLQQQADKGWPFASAHVVGIYATTDGIPKAFAVLGNQPLTAVGIHDYVLALQKGALEEHPDLRFVAQDPGNYGGEMACSTSLVNSNPIEECVFADSTTFGIIMVEGPQSSSLPIAQQLRAAAETRS